jgi:homoserine dehydrogenase
MSAPFRVGLLGLGHVGGALATRLFDDRERIAAAAGRPIVLEAIAVARPEGRTAPAPIVEAERLLERSGLDAVVELIGGLEPPHTYINTALRAGRQVITANKQLIAAQGPELARLGSIRFEAAVASAIPIVEVLAETLAADEIRSISGILNGTTNFILGAMAGGATYAAALADAQRLGLAEADPTADVDGHDAAAKLAILAMLAFRRRIDPSSIERVGIRNLGARELEDAERHDGVIKLVATARRDGEQIAADVRPRTIPRNDPLAGVGGAMNAITIDAAYAGTLTFAGPGAGPNAAASAVLGDLVRAAHGTPASAGMILAGLSESAVVIVSTIGP